MDNSSSSSDNEVIEEINTNDAQDASADGFSPAGPSEEPPALTEMESSIQKHGAKGRELYQETPWPCILLWKLAKFRPGGVSDEEWATMTSRRLMPRDLFMMYGVLSLWNELPHYGDEHFGRMHAIYSLLTSNAQAFVKVLRQAPEKLGIKPISPLDLKFNKTIFDAWNSYEADEAIRAQSRSWEDAKEAAPANEDASASLDGQETIGSESNKEEA